MYLTSIPIFEKLVAFSHLTLEKGIIMIKLIALFVAMLVIMPAVRNPLMAQSHYSRAIENLGAVADSLAAVKIAASQEVKKAKIMERTLAELRSDMTRANFDQNLIQLTASQVTGWIDNWPLDSVNVKNVANLSEVVRARLHIPRKNEPLNPKFRVPLFSPLHADSLYGAIYIGLSTWGKGTYVSGGAGGNSRFGGFSFATRNVRFMEWGEIDNEIAFEFAAKTIGFRKYGKLSVLSGLMYKDDLGGVYKNKAEKKALDKSEVIIHAAVRFECRGVFVDLRPRSALAPIAAGVMFWGQ